MSKSATLPAEPFEDPRHATGTPAWKQEVNQRLAAHRTRRNGSQDAEEHHAAESPRAASARAAEAAARVAARYAKAPSYSELLAGEARAVVRAAGAAAVAARNAQAAAQAVLAGLESGLESGQAGLWEQDAPRAEAHNHAAPSAPDAAPARWQDEPPPLLAQPSQAAPQKNAWAGAQPRWEEALPAHSDRDVWSEMRVHSNLEPGQKYESGSKYEPGQKYRPEERGFAREYGRDLPGADDIELFPLDAVASATVEPVQHLPANLIEFPRELVAARKARPRLAEAPFYNAAHEDSQLNIFEVDPAELTAPVYLSDTPAGTVAPPEWASIELDHGPEPMYAESVHPVHAYAHAPETLGSAVEAMPVSDGVAGGAQGTARGQYRDQHLPSMAEHAAEVRQKQLSQPPTVRAQAAVELLVAPLSDRLLASVVDGALVTLAFLAAAVVVIASTAHPPTGRTALIASGCGLLLFGMLYQYLFLSYAEEGTPGMRYARIALCTFDDDNPTIEQMRLRIPAMLVAALPAALGLFWAIFDGDHLGWHDRLTKTYQRKY